LTCVGVFFDSKIGDLSVDLLCVVKRLLKSLRRFLVLILDLNRFIDIVDLEHFAEGGNVLIQVVEKEDSLRGHNYAPGGYRRLSSG